MISDDDKWRAEQDRARIAAGEEQQVQGVPAYAVRNHKEEFVVIYENRGDAERAAASLSAYIEHSIVPGRFVPSDAPAGQFDLASKETLMVEGEEAVAKVCGWDRHIVDHGDDECDGCELCETDSPSASDPAADVVAAYNQGFEEGAAVERAKQADAPGSIYGTTVTNGVTDAPAVETVDVVAVVNGDGTFSGDKCAAFADRVEAEGAWGVPSGMKLVGAKLLVPLLAPEPEPTAEQVLTDTLVANGVPRGDAQMLAMYSNDALRAAGLIPREGEK